MRSLYEIDQAILACLDEETGEVMDLAALEQLSAERDVKIENVALYYKNLSAEVAAIKAEESALADRRKAKENKAKRLKLYLSEALNGEPMETARVKLSFRKSTKCVIYDGSELLSYLEQHGMESCIKRKDPEISVADVGKLLKAGDQLPGVGLEESNNIQIK